MLPSLLHWFLLSRIAPLAWVVFALSLYSVIFLLADLNAARLRPIYIDGDDLVVRNSHMAWSRRAQGNDAKAARVASHQASTL